jgi:hypothetical protein
MQGTLARWPSWASSLLCSPSRSALSQHRYFYDSLNPTASGSRWGLRLSWALHNGVASHTRVMTTTAGSGLGRTVRLGHSNGRWVHDHTTVGSGSPEPRFGLGPLAPRQWLHRLGPLLPRATWRTRGLSIGGIGSTPSGRTTLVQDRAFGTRRLPAGPATDAERDHHNVTNNATNYTVVDRASTAASPASVERALAAPRARVADVTADAQRASADRCRLPSQVRPPRQRLARRAGQGR